MMKGLEVKERGFSQTPLLEADKLIMNNDPRITRPCLVKELAAYLEKNGKFKKGHDIIDAKDKIILRWRNVINLHDQKDFAELLKIALLILHQMMRIILQRRIRRET